MGSPAGSIGAALFGSTRQAVLRLFLGNPNRRYYLRQVIASVNCGTGAVQRELEQLSRAGILLRTVEGRQTYFQANPACPVFGELRGLVRKTFGITDILRHSLGSIRDRLNLAFVYGSIAAGNEKASSDIDVMLVGDLSVSDAVDALAQAEQDLAREINPSVYGLEEFRRKLTEGHHFLSSVLAGQKIYLVGDESELKRLAAVRLAQRTQNKRPGNRRSPRHR
jgi:hypothetical protein